MITATMKKIRVKYLVGFIQSGSRESQDSLDFSNADGLIPSIGGEHVNAEGGVEIPDNKFVSREYFLANPKSHIKQDDILLVKDGATIGKLGISKIPTELAANEHVYIIRSKDSVNQKWLYYLLRSNQVQSDIKLATRGSAQGGLSKDFLNLQVQNIEEEQQKKVADFLDQKVTRIDEAIAKKKKLISLLEEKRTTSIANSLVEELRKEKTVKKSIKYVAKINNKSLKETTDPNKQIRYIDISSVDTKGFNGVFQEFLFSEAPSRARRFLSKGSTIIATVRTYLKAVAFFENPEEDIVVSTGFAVLDPGREVYPKFLYYSLTSDNFVQEVEAESVGVSYPAINPSDLGLLKIDLPSLEVQKAIVSKLDALVSSIELAKEKIQESINLLEEYKTSLISNAIVGKVKI